MNLTKQSRKRQLTNIFGGSFGNVLEWYDFLLYGFLASYLAPLFWPSATTQSLEVTLAIFAVSYIARPIGSLFFGHFADRFGRKGILLISSLLIGVMTVALGCLPTYSQIGIKATIILLIVRFLQGLSVGGEYMNSAIFLVEHASEKRRGFYGAMTNIGGGVGSAWAALIVWFLVSWFTSQEIEAWAWRLPFWLGFINLILSLYLRWKMDETPVFKNLKTASKFPILDALTTEKLNMCKAFALVALQGISYYTITVYFTLWAVQSKIVSTQQTFASTCVAIMVNIAGAIISGLVSDRLGRKIVLLTGVIGLLVATPMVFHAILVHKTAVAFIWGQSIFGLLFGVYNGSLPTALTEMFPARVRCSAMSVSYNLAAGIFGGTAPLISLYLAHHLNNAMMPAIYVMLSALVAGFVLLFGFKERFNLSLKK